VNTLNTTSSGNSSDRFQLAHELLQFQVDHKLLPGVSSAVIKDGKQIDSFCAGFADIERSVQLRPDHLHRAFSNTKLVTTTLALLLHDQGHYGLDDTIKKWIPEFAQVRVLRPGATSLTDTVALQRDITIRHLLSHQAGLSHGVFDPGTLIYKAYHASGVRKPDTTLAEMIPKLAALPLVFQPGTGWEYSMATDVLARLIEIVTGQCFADALQSRVFDPLGMVDTSHLLRPDQISRLTVLYRGVDDTKPNLSGLNRLDNVPWSDAFIKPVSRQAGTSGLVTTQADMIRLLTQIVGGQLLKRDTLKEMFRDQLAPEHCVNFFHTGPMPSFGFGLGGAITRASSTLQPNSPLGELQWGGLAGTHWSISPATGIINVLMCQRYMGFWNPFWFEYKERVHQVC
jgi:CubicO group peptidase (beta-lactamase class C family)